MTICSIEVHLCLQLALVILPNCKCETDMYLTGLTCCTEVDEGMQAYPTSSHQINVMVHDHPIGCTSEVLWTSMYYPLDVYGPHSLHQRTSDVHLGVPKRSRGPLMYYPWTLDVLICIYPCGVYTSRTWEYDHSYGVLPSTIPLFMTM